MKKIDIKKRRINFLVTERMDDLLEQLTVLQGGNKSLVTRTCVYDFIKRRHNELIL